MKGLQEYCAPYSRWYFKAFCILSAVSGVSALSILVKSRGAAVQDIALLMIVPAVFFILGFAFWYHSPFEKFKRTCRKFKRKGLEEVLVSDFNKAVPQYDDHLRLGEKYIFVCGEGVIVELAKLKNIYRQLDIYVGRPKDRDVLTINHDTFVGYHKLCEIDTALDSEENWKKFCDEINWRAPKVKTIPDEKVWYHYPDSGD